MPATPALSVAAVALPLSLVLTSASVRAQYWTDFDNLEVAPAAVPYAPALWDATQPIMTPGQDNYFSPVATSVPHLAQIYTGGTVLAGFNDYGIPDNPTGGTQFIVGEGPAGGVYARAERSVAYPPTTWGGQRWAWSTDLCVKFVGALPTAQNCGSLSVQPFPGSQSFIMLARWTDINTATNWNADYIWFDAAGAQVTAVIPDPAFQTLNVDHWYRWSTVANLVTNEIEEVRLTDLTTGVTVTHNPVGAYMEGGTAGSAAPTGFRFFAGGGVAGNVIAWDNASVLPAGGITELPGCGANPANSLTVTSSPSWPTLGSTLTLDLDAPAGSVGVGSIGATFLSLTGHPTLPCGTPLPAPFVGNALIGLPIGASMVSLSPWAGPGSPVSMTFATPATPQLAGVCIFVQGALVDFATGTILLTTGSQVALGG